MSRFKMIYSECVGEMQLLLRVASVMYGCFKADTKFDKLIVFTGL